MYIERYKRQKHHHFGKILLVCVCAFCVGLCFYLGTHISFGHNGGAHPKVDASTSVQQRKTAPKNLRDLPDNATEKVSKESERANENKTAMLSKIWLRIVKHEHILYVMSDREVIAKYGIAVGKNKGQKEKAGDCRTPEGKFSVQSVQSAKGWSHDFKDGKGVIPNAYGPWFIRLKTGWNGVGIHGTHDPNSIGKNVTEGCIRLKNENVDVLKRKYIKPGMSVIIEN